MNKRLHFCSYLDALLETDSDEDNLVVDDQNGNFEFTSNLKENNTEDITDTSTGAEVQDIPECLNTLPCPDPAPCGLIGNNIGDSGIGAFKYYVIALGGGGGPASIADADDALRLFTLF